MLSKELEMTLNLAFKEAREKGTSKALVREKTSPSRFLVLSHSPSAKSFILFDFIVDKVLENIYMGIPYDITIIQKGGKTFYNNRPYNVSTTHSAIALSLTFAGIARIRSRLATISAFNVLSQAFWDIVTSVFIIKLKNFHVIVIVGYDPVKRCLPTIFSGAP